MNSRLLSLIPFIALLLTPSPHDNSAAARKQVEAAYAKLNAALERKDVNGTLALYAPNFQSIGDKGGKGSLATLKKTWQREFALIQSVRSTSTIRTFSLKGNRATARVHLHKEAVVMNPQTDQLVTVVSDAEMEDVWVQGASGWRKRQSRTLSIRRKIEPRT